MTGFLFFIYIIICIFLLTAILMQAGKGGGLAEAFSSAENILGGTQTNKFMVKLTTVLAVLFLGFCLVFAYINSRKQQSLMADFPDRRHSTVVNVEKLFDQKPAQTIEINAMAPAAAPKTSPAEKPAAPKK
ncbi:MAG: preprotein translocase subunit SecG [Candidatus Omnitrophica bacterium]|nr:preprotein translocase subunit SecG [Candidatus Omnitrophota bacterium]